MDEEEQERKRKLEAGKAKLAQFRQRKGQQSDGQNVTKKSKKKKTSPSTKQRDNPESISEAGPPQSNAALSQTGPSGAATTAEFTIMRTLPQGEVIQHDKTYTIEVVDDLFPFPANDTAHILWEEEFGVRETFSERGTQSSQARLEVMEDELAGKQQEIEELNRELEEMRAAYGTEGLQQLQEFETAIKQRDGIITQLTANLQQARKEKDDIMREFLELTEQSQKLKIQFQHLQAGETLRNSSHSSTAADLLHSKQQILTYQQQLEEREQNLKYCQKENEDLQIQIVSLQEQIHSVQQERQRELESSYEQRLNEKDLVADSLKSALHNEEIKCTELQERIYAAEKSVDELREQLTQKSLEINSLSEELNTSKQRERRSSDEIKQLMGAVEDLQKRHHKDSQSEADLVQRKESETQRKLEQLQAELDEMYGQQIVQMKQELVRQHTLEIEKLLDQHRQELENITSQATITVTSERINELNAVISELNAKLLESNAQRDKMKEDLSKKLQVFSSEKSHLQKQIKDLLQDLSFAREQIHRTKQSLTEKDNKLNEANSFLTTIDDLKAELVAAKEFTKELESKHEAEVTNYKIKLDMLEREKDAVLDRMAESQEAELEKVRTYFLFSQEEELSKLREELTREHKTNIENLEIRYKNQIEQIQHDLNQTIAAMQSEKDSLITKQNNLMLEISKLKDPPQSLYDPKSEEMMVQINELQKELECLRREEEEKGSIEQEVQVLQLRIEVLEKEVEDKDALKEKLAVLEADNRLLKDENEALQNMTKDRNSENHEKFGELDNSDLKNQIEVLSSENERLRNLELQLKEEIEKQKNTYSFAEKNFEVNYHELKDEYTVLVKEKERLEGSKTKLEEEYRLRLEALHEELAKLKGDTIRGPSKSIKADGLDDGEVVEKDTTELMEKLEIAQRDKQELSQKLSSLSKELQSKQKEINLLKEKLRTLSLEGDGDTLKESSAGASNVLVSNDGGDATVVQESIRPLESPHLNVSPQGGHLQKEVQDLLMERESILQRLQEWTDKFNVESSLLESKRLENDELRGKLHRVVQEQADLMLQLEAQRISLTHIHKAHLELTGENFREEKEQELRRLRDSLLTSQEQKIQELRALHQQQLLTHHPQQTGDTCQDLTEMLLKRITEECCHMNQVLGEQMNDEDTTDEAPILESVHSSIALEHHRAAVQTLKKNLETLLERFLKEYKQMRDLSSAVKTGDHQAAGEDREIPLVAPILIHSKNTALSQSGVQEALISPSEEVERLKLEFGEQRSQLEDKHTRDIQHLRSYFQQQLKENEDRFSTEIIHLQEQLQDATAGSPETRELYKPEVAVELGSEEFAIFQSLITPSSDLLKIEDPAQMGDHSLRQPFGPIYHQLQTLRQALYSKYVEEVNALKKQHEAELDQLRAQLTKERDKESEALKQEIIRLTNAKHEILHGSFQETPLYPIPEEKEPEDLNQLVEERFQEKMEEEVARVIVEMAIAFAQQTELARLASLKDATEHRESPEERSETPAEKAEQDDQKLQDEASLEGSPVTPTEHPEDCFSEDTSQVLDPLPKEKTVVLNEEDYNHMVAMGAEGAKFKQMYEEKVEDMRQELVRQEQEYQQAAEALRLAHAAQLERQMYDQEQLLLEVHRLRAQLVEDASVMSDPQATDREQQLLAELETLRVTCAELETLRVTCAELETLRVTCAELETLGVTRAEVSGRGQARPLQDSSSQTQDERRLLQPESKEQDWECEQGDGEPRADEGNLSSDVTGDSRKSLKRTNKHLLKILLEVVKTTGAVEETIGRHVVSLLEKSGRRQSASKVHVWSAEPEDLEAACPAAINITAPNDGDVGVGVEGAGIWSESSPEELDVPLQLTEEGFSGSDLSPDEEAQILNISIRLQAAVEKLLEAINDTSNQLAHAKAAQTELVRESIKRKQETTELLRCQEELQERLNEEAKAREHLALELSKAEGLLDGYTDERVFLEKQMQEKNDLIRHLEQELQCTGNRLQELEQERQQIQEEKELLSRQKLALKADAAPAEQRLVEAAVVAAPEEELLEETEKLLKEKIEVQRQAEKDSGDLHKQVKVLEVELEEQVNHYKELEQEKNADLEDLRQKNLALEKQLEKTRRFLDEQAVDREHERDVFQQEIQKLEQQLKMPQRHQPVNDHQSNEVEKLESSLKEKTDKCSELLLCKEQLQRDVQERNEEMEKMECRIRELEQALIISSDSLQKVEDRRPSIVIGLRGEMPLEAQLQVEREATDRKEKEITNLVEQLEQFREELENKNEEVQQLHMQLEIQRKEAETRLQELEQENKVLKGEVESTQHEHPQTVSSKLPNNKPGKTEELLLLKDQEIDLLNEQITKLQIQLEAATDNKVIEKKNEQIKEYKSQIKCLKSDQEQLKKNSEEEIEKLNEVIEKLQEELSRIEQKVAMDFTDKVQYEDVVDTKEIGQGDAPFADREEENVEAIGKNTSVEHERRNEIAPVSSESEEMQLILQNMEFKLIELQEIVKKKDEEIVTLQKQSLVMKDLEETVQRLQIELEEKKSKELESSRHKPSLDCPENLTLPLNTEGTNADETLMPKEVERQHFQDDLEHKVKFSEMPARKQGDDKVRIERLTEELREKTAQYLAVEALLASVQETSKDAIHRLQIQLHDLQRTVHEKDSQLMELTNTSSLLENQEIERLNEEVKILQQKLSDAEGAIDGIKKGEGETLIEDTETSRQRVDQDEGELSNLKTELEKTRMEMDVLEKELEQYKLLQQPIDITNVEVSKQRNTSIEDEQLEILQQKVAQDEHKLATMKAELEKTRIEMALLERELEKQKLLLDVKNHEESERVEIDVGGSPETGLEETEFHRQKVKQDESELMRMKAELEKTRMEMALLERELEKQKLLQQSIGIKNHEESERVEIDVGGSPETGLEETEFHQQKVKQDESELMRMKAELEKTRMEMALLERELEKQKLLQQSIGIKNHEESERVEIDVGGSPETGLEETEFHQQKVKRDESELIRMKEELEKTRMEMALLEKELEKHILMQKPIDLEQSFPKKTIHPSGDCTEKTDITTVNNMELQIQELQNVIRLRDVELLEYVNQKDLLDQQTKEIERLRRALEDFTKEKQNISLDSAFTTKDGERQTSQGEILMENKEVQKNSDGGDTLEVELQATKKAMALLKEELEKIKDIKTKDGGSQTRQQDISLQNLEGVPQDDGEVMRIKAELEKTRTEMASVEEELANLKSIQRSGDVKEGEESRSSGRPQKKRPKTKSSKKAAQSLESQVAKTSMEETTMTTAKEMELQELQNILNLKDAALLQCENQKDLLNQQAQEIEHLKMVIREFSEDERTGSMDSCVTTKDGESQTSHKPTLTESREVQKDFDGNNVLQAELEKTKMEMAELKEELETLKDSQKHRDVKIEDYGGGLQAELDGTKMEVAELKKELEKLRECQKHKDVKIEDGSFEDLNKGVKEQSVGENRAKPLASQQKLTSTFESTQQNVHDMESRLQELQKLIKQKDAELEKHLNQQSQQTVEINRLHDEMETLNQKLGKAGLKIGSLTMSEDGIQKVTNMEKKSRQLMNGETFVSEPSDDMKESRQTLRCKDNVDDQDPFQIKRSGDATCDDDLVKDALRDETVQHLTKQVLLSSVQETMQTTIDAMENRLEEMQKVVKEKDLEILLYLEEIETLKELVKAESDQHGQLMLAMEDTLRENVAAALVSDAQLKAIQAHTNQLHHDDRSTTMAEDDRRLHALNTKSSMEEEAEAKLSALSLRLLELEKQLSDLHEQLQVEREQVNLANQRAAEKEQQLRELQKILESSRGRNMDTNQAEGAEKIGGNSISQGTVTQSESNTVTDMENMLYSVKAEATATKEELCHYREMAEKLKEELMIKESNLAHLEEDLRDVRRCLAHAEEKLAFYMKKELQEEEHQTMSGVDFTDGLRSPDWTTKDRSTSSSQTEMVLSVNNGNQTSQVHHKHIGVQKELESTHLHNSSEEVAELMECYTDKINQMQELHAAEILDMETRHITEADTLRREQYTVVQALTNECEALKAVIEALKSSGGAVPDSVLSASYHLTDAASSECDWSQGTCDAQSLDQLPEGLRAEDEGPEEFIPNKIKDLLRAVHQEGMQVLSLTEATSPEKDKSFTLNTQSWREERKTLIETIASLRDLIAKMQIYKEPEVHTRSDFHDRCPDWRGELLRAIQEVFCREQDALLSAFHTQLSTLSNVDATTLVNHMQHQLQEQGMEQISAMDCIQNAERRSLLLEIQDLRAQLTSLHMDRNGGSMHHTERAAVYVPQDPSSLPQEVHLQLNSMKAKAGDLQEQLGSERLLASEIKDELALTKMELESTLKLQHKHFKELESLRMELKKRREELDGVNDALANEQKKTRELQWALEKEKTKSDRSEQQEKEALEDLQILLEDQKTKTLEISKLLEEEQLLVRSLQEQMTSRESLHDAALSQERSKVSELQALLDAEKTRSLELSNALQCKQGVEARVRSTETAGEAGAHNLTEELLRDLQGQLESKGQRIVELVTEAEAYKLESVQLRQNLQEERQRIRKELEAEKEAAKLAKNQVEGLKSTVEELQGQIQDRVTEIRRLQSKESQYKETIQNLQRSQRSKESGPEKAESSATVKTSSELVRSERRQSVGSVPNVLCPDPLSTINGDPDTEGAAFSVDTIRRKLQQVSSKLRQLAAKATRRLMFEATDDDDLAWSQRTLQEVVSQLGQVSMLSLQGQSLVLPPGISANTLTEKLLTQNAELTGYVSRLTNEKNDLQNALLRLEGEISHHRAREDAADHPSWDHTLSTDSFTEEREAWTREKLNLHKSLKQMEAELSKVKADLRNETIQRDLGRDTDNAALKRVYGKYLRSESFRKALVYQKKYLLLLLGGFQECEEATLALIARMGGQASYTDLEVITKHSRAFTRFRSAARVAIAISRMKFLVRRWHRAVSPMASPTNRNGFGQNIGNEVRTDSPYHPAGSVDMYVDQRLSSCRSRSGFDSPQSTVNSQHRFASSDLNPSSHLQNYDPDRALTDYIARLEALQKRLGTVPSGSSSTAHHSVRR
ncbi:A-kinase anchor protein 9 isoform X4 [Engystomops pustulosus]|uniref:A-kinase anchor protein 9 isoform X4 n=1 Tax=Engystomops pustulosus TaxID=76066 RepID=UPI003AFA609E